MRRAIATITLAGVIVGGLFAAAIASPVGSARYHKVSGPGPRTVIFHHMGSQEDSCARARLVRYEGDLSVYRCATP